MLLKFPSVVVSLLPLHPFGSGCSLQEGLGAPQWERDALALVPRLRFVEKMLKKLPQKKEFWCGFPPPQTSA